MSKSSAEFDFGVFITKYRKPLTGGAIALVVVVAGGWFWRSSKALKEERAEVAYSNAAASYYSGNPQVAESDINGMVRRYSGTPAAVRATILLAKTEFELKKHALGVTQLRDVVSSRVAKPFRAEIYALIGAGLENQEKFDEAATAFGQAASAASMVADREAYLASQARAYESARNKPAALKIWQGIAARENSPLAPEARLRIGELTAAPAKGG